MIAALTYAIRLRLMRPSQVLLRVCQRTLMLMVLSFMVMSPPAHAAEIITTQAALESSSEGYRLSTSFDFILNQRLEDALMRGVPLYFTADVELTRKRWYWLDETAVSVARTTRIAYNVLTGQYHVSVSGQLQRSFNTLDDALALLRRPARWIIAPKNALQSGTTYMVATRLRLDVSQLPKPFQINAINDSDWRFASEWKTFTFDTE